MSRLSPSLETDNRICKLLMKKTNSIIAFSKSVQHLTSSISDTSDKVVCYTVRTNKSEILLTRTSKETILEIGEHNQKRINY